MRPHGYGIVPAKQPVIDLLKVRGATMDGTEQPDVEDDDDFEDEALSTFLKGLELGGTEFTIFAGKRVSLESLIAVANMGEDETYVIDWLKDKLPTLVEDARKKIGTKAFDSANGGPLSDDEIRIYDEKVEAMKGGMSKSGVIKKLMQKGLKNIVKKNTSDNAKAVRKMFKEAKARGYIE